MYDIFGFLQLNSEPSSELDKQHSNAQTEQVKMAATEAGGPRRLGLNLNLSVQPHANAYHWPHSTVAEDTSPSRSKGCTDDDDDDDEDDRDMDDRDMDDDDMMDCRQDEDCSPEDEQDILEMQVIQSMISLLKRLKSLTDRWCVEGRNKN